MRAPRKRETPTKVPVVPTPATQAWIGPSTPAAISGPVVRSWVDGLTALWNWSGTKAPGVSAAICRARSTAPVMSASAGVRTTSAPRARMSFAFTWP